MDYGGQYGNSGTSKSGRIRLLNALTVQEKKTNHIKLVPETGYVHRNHVKI